MTIFERMLDAVDDTMSKYMEHPFVKGIEDGTLSKERFKHYMIQDYLYLREYTKAFGIGIAKASDINVRKIFSSYVNMLTEYEMNVHSEYFDEFGITAEELDKTPISLAALSYGSYILRLAYEEGQAEILAAVIFCAYSYEAIAKNILKRSPNSVDNAYGQWIKSYVSDTYSNENAALFNAVEKLVEGYTEKQKQHIVDILVICAKYELEFWNMAWNMQ